MTLRKNNNQSISPSGDPTDYYNKSQTNALLNAKADTSLSNLSSAGQMVIDSQNGTISNCVLEIPQNIKLTLENNVLTLKSGSVITLAGSTYSTVTTTQDDTLTIPTDDTWVVFSHINGLSIGNYIRLNRIGSGNTLPADGTDYQCFYNTTDKLIYMWYNNQWTEWSVCYPLCVVKVENGNMSFAKDSNGNDMIFNGAGFIGHHAFVYPNVKVLSPNGFNDDGSLKSNIYNRTSFFITEMNSGNNGFDIASNTAIYRHNFGEDYQSIEELENNVVYHYIINDNIYAIIRNNVLSKSSIILFIKFTYDGTTVTDFTIRQPVRTATVEMVDKKQNDITTITGYDATKTQTLKNVNGTLTWVDD